MEAATVVLEATLTQVLNANDSALEGALPLDVVQSAVDLGRLASHGQASNRALDQEAVLAWDLWVTRALEGQMKLEVQDAEGPVKLEDQDAEEPLKLEDQDAEEPLKLEDQDAEKPLKFEDQDAEEQRKWRDQDAEHQPWEGQDAEHRPWEGQDEKLRPLEDQDEEANEKYSRSLALAHSLTATEMWQDIHQVSVASPQLADGKLPRGLQVWRASRLLEKRVSRPQGPLLLKKQAEEAVLRAEVLLLVDAVRLPLEIVVCFLRTQMDEAVGAAARQRAGEMLLLAVAGASTNQQALLAAFPAGEFQPAVEGDERQLLAEVLALPTAAGGPQLVVTGPAPSRVARRAKNCQVRD